MTAARLEELAAKCEEAIAPDTPDIASVLTIEDVADLARCARAWAKVEWILHAHRGFSVELWRKTSGHIRMLTHSQSVDGPTAIEAVEAAEVKP